MRIRKLDNELQIVFGEVYAPGFPDSQGDFMTEESIQKMAHRFMENLRLRHIDTNHNNEKIDAVVVESFLARKGDLDFIPGSWVVGVHVADKDQWGKIKKGEFNGFSIEGGAVGVVKEIEIEVPEYVIGKTDEVAEHSHRFTVHFDEEGQFLGGTTDDEAGHSHEIKKGTMTEEVNGHSHRFSFYEVILNEQA